MRQLLIIISFFVVAVPAHLIAAEEEDPLVLHGAIGFRGEYMLNENFAETPEVSDDDQRFRGRVRVRFGLKYTPTSIFTAGFRISTGAANYPTSGWTSFNDEFRRDAISLDRAFVNARLHKHFELRMGYQANPLFRPTQLLWDDDVQPGGLAEIIRVGNLEMVLGQFMLKEIRSLGDDASFLLANSIAYNFQAIGLKLGVFNYHYTDPDVVAEAIESGQLASDFRTNRFQPDGSAAYFSGYSMVGAGAEWHYGKVLASVDVSYNLSAKSDASLPGYENKEAFAAGGLVGYGLLEELWDWQIVAGAFYIPADAALAAFNSDEYQQTNVLGLPLIASLELEGGFRLVWDSFFQRKLDVNHAANGGLTHPENALKIRSRVTIIGYF